MEKKGRYEGEGGEEGRGGTEGLRKEPPLSCRTQPFEGRGDVCGCVGICLVLFKWKGGNGEERREVEKWKTHHRTSGGCRYWGEKGKGKGGRYIFL